MNQKATDDQRPARTEPGDEATSGAPANLPAPVPSKRRRRWLRPLLLIAGPLAVIAGGAWWYYSGGRYISTENAYVQADMVAVSPQVSGPIAEVRVHENQHVNTGDVLFMVEQQPYRIGVEQAQGQSRLHPPGHAIAQGHLPAAEGKSADRPDQSRLLAAPV